MLTCRPAPECGLFISLASLAVLPDSLWGQRNSSIKLRAHLCPYSSQKELASTIIAFYQWYHHHAIARCKNRLQEIDLILIWQNYQERKLERGIFSGIDCVLKERCTLCRELGAWIIDHLAYWLFGKLCDGTSQALKSMLNGVYLTWYLLFDLLQLITLIRIQSHLKIWVITEIAFWLSLPRWQLWWIGGCRSLWQWFELNSEDRGRSWRFWRVSCWFLIWKKFCFCGVWWCGRTHKTRVIL